MRFADVVRIVNGRNQRAVESPTGKYPIYGSGGEMGRADDYICEAGTVVIGRKGSINNPIFVAEPFWNVDTAFGLVADRTELDPKFLYYFCDHFDFERLNTTVTIPSLTKANLQKVEIDLPTLDKQRAIVTILDRVSELINLRKRQIGNLERLVKSRFVEMFGDDKYAVTRVPFKNICEFVTVGIANSATHAYSDTGVIMLRNQNIRENLLDETDLMHIKHEFAEKYKAKTLKENDILVTRTGYPGVACIVPKRYEGCQTFTTLIARLKDIHRTHPVYITHFINSCYGRAYVDKNKVGVAQQNFGAKVLDEMPIDVPPYEVQREFAAFIEQLDKSRFVLRKRLEKVRQMYRAKQQEYFG